MPGNNRDIDLSLVAAHQQAPVGGTEVRAKWHLCQCLGLVSPESPFQAGSEVSTGTGLHISWDPWWGPGSDYSPQHSGTSDGH